jgi:hypothetical protein
MFYGASSFDQPIGDWDVSNVASLTKMFYNASSFNQPIGDWDVSYVWEAAEMFRDASSFNQPIGNWTMPNATEMGYMFNGASSFNQSLCSWPMSLDVNQVTLTGIFSFSGCSETSTPGAASDNWCQPCQNSTSTDCRKECQELLVDHADPGDKLEFQQAIMDYLMEESNQKCCSFLHLSGFQLTGTLSTEIGMLTNLVGMDLHLNSLTGELPTELGLLTQLSYLDLGNNEFNGTLPVEISNLQSLEFLDLGSNVLLSGTIPSAFADLNNLRELNLHFTSLEGEVDISICENMFQGMLN